MLLTRAGTLLHGASLSAALAFALALGTTNDAAATTYEITAEGSGTGFFDLDGMFDLPGPQGNPLPYTLRISAAFDDPVLSYSAPTRTVWTDNDATVRVELIVNGLVYTTEQHHRYVDLDYYAGVGGAPYNVLKVYVDFLPYGSGNSASLWQTMTLPQRLLPFTDTLAPVALATPEILGGGIDGGIYVIHHDVFVQLGTVSASLDQISYTITAVPEPGSLVMLGAGLAVLAAAARRSTRGT